MNAAEVWTSPIRTFRSYYIDLGRQSCSCFDRHLHLTSSSLPICYLTVDVYELVFAYLCHVLFRLLLLLTPRGGIGRSTDSH